MPAVHADRIRDLRRRRNLSNQQLAQRCRVSALHVENIQGGRKPPSIEVVFLLARTLGVPVGDLLVDGYQEATGPGGQIRERRRRLGLKVSQLADMVGCSPQYLDNNEGGRRRGGRNLLTQISKVLDNLERAGALAGSQQ